MRASATSLLVRGENPARLSSAIREAALALGRPAGGLVLAAGAMAGKLSSVADSLGRAELGLPMLLASGSGVMTERGEVEGESAGTRYNRCPMAKRYTISDGKLVLTLEEAEEGGFIVTSPLDPGLNTEAETVAEAFEMARDASTVQREAACAAVSNAPAKIRAVPSACISP